MSTTELQLLATYRRTAIPVEQACTDFLGISPDQARRKAALNQLPFATFRLGESQKSPLLVRLSDLAKAIDARAAEAEAERINALV